MTSAGAEISSFFFFNLDVHRGIESRLKSIFSARWLSVFLHCEGVDVYFLFCNRCQELTRCRVTSSWRSGKLVVVVVVVGV